MFRASKKAEKLKVHTGICALRFSATSTLVHFSRSRNAFGASPHLASGLFASLLGRNLFVARRGNNKAKSSQPIADQTPTWQIDDQIFVLQKINMSCPPFTQLRTQGPPKCSRKLSQKATKHAYDGFGTAAKRMSQECESYQALSQRPHGHALAYVREYLQRRPWRTETAGCVTSMC